MSEVEMRLDRDEFIVNYDSTRIGEAKLLAIVKESGYTASIVANNESSAPVDDDSGSRDDPIFVEALARAKKENKPLVLDFYADWCTPCLKMLKTTIPDPKVATLLKKCVFLKVDTDKHPELAKSFGVVGLPDIRFLAPDGSEIKRLQDYMDADTFAGELEEVLNNSSKKKKPQANDGSVSLIDLSPVARFYRNHLRGRMCNQRTNEADLKAAGIGQPLVSLREGKNAA